jgi:hypothetical protein
VVSRCHCIRPDDLVTLSHHERQCRVACGGGNIVFKFACALHDFDQQDRAAELFEQLRQVEASGYRF